MNYVARSPIVTAEPVTLKDQSFMAVLVHGVAMLMDAQAFGMLYERAKDHERSMPEFRHPSVTPEKKAAPVAKKAVPVKKPVGPGPTAVLIALVTEYPSTTAELQDRLLDRIGRDKGNKVDREWAYQAIWAALKNGKLVKKTDPETQLTRIHLVEGLAS